MLAGYLALRTLSVVAALVGPLLVALVVVYLLNPVVEGLQRHRVPRPVGTALTGLTGLAVVAAAAVWVVPALVEQARAALTTLPSALGTLEAVVDDLVARWGLPVDVDLDGVAVQQWLAGVEDRQLLFGSLATLGSVAAGAAHALVLAVTGLVLALFVLADLPRLGRAVLGLVPPRHREEVAGVRPRSGAPWGASCGASSSSRLSWVSPPLSRCG